MSNASQSSPRAAELVAAVRHVVDQRDELFTRLDDAEYALHLMQQERAELRRELDEMRDDMLRVFSMGLPGDRGWAFFEDVSVLALSPDLDRATREQLIAQTMPPKLTACGSCGAPVYSGQACGMHSA